MRITSILAIVLGALLVSVGAASAQRGAMIDLASYTLGNGLQVILVEDHSAPTVAVDVWYRVGGAHDPPGRSGFAHLFEHMMFQGSANVPPGAHFELIEQAGGDANATTGRDRTNYFNALPSHQLPLGLWLEAERMHSLVVDEARFAREREVVKEEYRQRIENQPYGEAFLLLQTLPYDYPPYQQPVIGSVEDLERATVEEVRAFHSTYYTPNNAVLVVAGDIEPEQARELIARFFGDIPRGDPPPDLPPLELVDQQQAEVVTLEDSLARVPAMFIGYVIPPRRQTDFYAAQVLAYILGSGDSSRLARELIDPGLATDASTWVTGNLGPGLFGVFLVPSEGVPVEQLAQVYYDQLEAIRVYGVDADELAKVINQIRAEQIAGLETALGLAESVQAANFYLGDSHAVLAELERYRSVSSADIQQVAERYLSQQDRHVIEVLPTSGGAR